MLFRKLSKVISHSPSIFNIKITGSLPEAALSSFLILGRLNNYELEQSSSAFRSRLFHDLPAVPKDVSKLLKPKEKDFNKRYSELFYKLEHIKSEVESIKYLDLTPELVSESLKVVYEFLDKASIGFLSGDFSIELLESLIGSIGLIDKSCLEANHDFFKKVEEYIRNQDFCIPKYGVPHPEKENPQALYIREVFIERDSPQVIMNSINSESQFLTHSAFSLNYLTPKEKLIELFANTSSMIRMEQANCVQRTNPSFNKDYANLIISINADKQSILTLTTLLESCARIQKNQNEKISVKYSDFLEELTKSLSKQLIEDKTEELIKSFNDKRAKDKKFPIKNKEITTKMLSKEIYLIKKKVYSMKSSIFSLSGFLIMSTIESLRFRNVKDEETLITHNLEYNPETKKRSGYLYISQKLLRILLGYKASNPQISNYLYLDRTLPMICPPINWVDWETGGYLHKSFSIMRSQGSRFQKQSLERADLSKICRVLNIMGNTPWRINSKVLDIVENIYKSGGGLGEIPQVDKGNLFMPKPGASFIERQKLKQKKRDNWSLLSDFELKLGIARKFNLIGRFYLPLNVDFRGRIYPISPHLNQIGNDLARGLLEFADGKKLGPSGLRWMKIHLANKMGHDKLPINERISIIEGSIEKINLIANDPISNKEWLSYEDPWQSLATIFELVSALQSPVPEEYFSHLHIHQDGSCNGLQHYAALGRDNEGAEQVNLAERDRPGDLYTAVAVNVQKIIDSEAAKGDEIAVKLVGKIKRKVVKQTVMTSVYGVTYIGARDQILKQLKDRANLEENDLVPAAAYLAKITMKVLEDFFSGAQRIKYWLIDCAKKIARSGHPVTWITPLGLPVIQPYRKGTNLLYIDTYFQRVSFQGNKDSLPISVPKQKSAFPPNFVHSLDSTHLMMTVLACKEQGIEFAAVHDSFWTHACDVDQMNKILRQQFVNLHSQPLLQRLLDDFRKMYPSIKFNDVPKRGKFDLNRVLESTYFFA